MKNIHLVLTWEVIVIKKFNFINKKKVLHLILSSSLIFSTTILGANSVFAETVEKNNDFTTVWNGKDPIHDVNKEPEKEEVIEVKEEEKNNGFTTVWDGKDPIHDVNKTEKLAEEKLVAEKLAEEKLAEEKLAEEKEKIEPMPTPTPEKVVEEEKVEENNNWDWENPEKNNDLENFFDDWENIDENEFVELPNDLEIKQPEVIKSEEKEVYEIWTNNTESKNLGEGSQIFLPEIDKNKEVLKITNEEGTVYQFQKHDNETYYVFSEGGQALGYMLVEGDLSQDHIKNMDTLLIPFKANPATGDITLFLVPLAIIIVGASFFVYSEYIKKIKSIY